MIQALILLLLYAIMYLLPSLSGALPSNNPLFLSTVLGFLLLASFFIGRGVRKMGLPLITGYLLSGILFGPWSLGLFDLEHIEKLNLLNNLALSLIALSAGAELEWSSLKKRLGKIMFISFSQIAVLFFGVFLLFYYLFKQRVLGIVNSPESAFFAALFLGVIATANSPSSVIAIINETKAKGVVSETVLSISVLKDVLVIGLFAFVVSYSVGKEGVSNSQLFGAIFMEAVLSVIVGSLIGVLVIAYLKMLRKEKFLFTLGIAVFCSTISTLLHLNDLLLAISTGFMVRNFMEDGGGFMKWLERGSMPIFVLFFSLAGASLNIDALKEMWVAAVTYFVVRLILLILSTYASARLMGEAKPTQKYLWSGFVPQAGVSLGFAVLIEREFPGWGSTLATLIIASITLNQIIGPILFKFAIIACKEGRNSD